MGLLGALGDVYNVQVKFNLDNAEFLGKMKGIEAGLVSFGRKMSMLVTAPILGLGVVLSKLGIDAAEAKDKIRVIFAENNDEIIEWSKTTSAAITQTKLQAMDQASTLYAMMKGMGLAKDKSLELSESMVELAADVASIRNEAPEEIFGAMRAAISGEMEPLKRLGVGINENVIKAKAAKMGFKELHGQLEYGDKIMATYAILSEQLSYANNNVRDTAEMGAGSIRQLTARLTELGQDLGVSLIPSILSFTKYLRNGVEWINRTTKSFRELSPEQQNSRLMWIGIAAAIGPALIGLGQAAAGIRVLIGLLGGPGGLIFLLASAAIALFTFMNMKADAEAKIQAERKEAAESGTLPSIVEDAAKNAVGVAMFSTGQTGFLGFGTSTPKELARLKRQAEEDKKNKGLVALQDFRKMVLRKEEMPYTLDENPYVPPGATGAASSDKTKEELTVEEKKQLEGIKAWVANDERWGQVQESIIFQSQHELITYEDFKKKKEDSWRQLIEQQIELGAQYGWNAEWMGTLSLNLKLFNDKFGSWVKDPALVAAKEAAKQFTENLLDAAHNIALTYIKGGTGEIGRDEMHKRFLSADRELLDSMEEQIASGVPLSPLQKLIADFLRKRIASTEKSIRADEAHAEASDRLNQALKDRSDIIEKAFKEAMDQFSGWEVGAGQKQIGIEEQIKIQEQLGLFRGKDAAEQKELLKDDTARKEIERAERLKKNNWYESPKKGKSFAEGSKGTYVNEAGDIVDTFTKSLQKALIAGMEGLIQSVESGDISSGIQGLFNTVGSAFAKRASEQITSAMTPKGEDAGFGDSLLGSIGGGLVGAGIGMLGSLIFGGGNKNAEGTKEKPIYAHITNVAEWFQFGFTLPMSNVLSGRRSSQDTDPHGRGWFWTSDVGGMRMAGAQY